MVSAAEPESAAREDRERNGAARAALRALEHALPPGVAVLAWSLHALVPAVPLPPLALALGVAAGVALARAPALRALRPAADVPLALGMVLLGAQCDRAALRAVGVTGLVLLVAHWFSAAAIVRAALRRAGEDERTASLAAVGLTGCGISAVLAAEAGDPRSPPRARTLAVAGVLVAGAAGFVVLPPLARALDLGPAELARLAGIALPTTAEAVLVGAAHSPEALRATGALRFAVNLLQWIPVLDHMRRHARRHAPRAAHAERAPVAASIARTATVVARRVPAFVWGLALVAAFAAADGFDARERAVLANVVNWAFLAALAGVGCALRPAEIARLGWRPVLAATAGWAGAAALLCVAVLLSA
jgi:uncharacterized membrane protein YadS